MFKFLKSLLKKEPEEIDVKTAEIGKWFSEQTEAKKDDFLEDVKPLLDWINDQKAAAKEAIRVLREAELKNKKIPNRAFTIMQGNRRHYTQKAERFIDSLHVPENFEDIVKFPEELNTRLENFAKSTSKSYHILQEFFSNESGDIAQCIRKIDMAAKKISSKKQEFARIELIDSLVRELEGKIRAKDASKKDKKLMQERLEQLENQLRKYKKELQKAKSSDDYKDYFALEKFRNETVEKIKAKEKELIHEFSVIERALKKYEKIALDTSMISDYIDDPINAIQKDENLKILDIIEGVKKSIGKLDLKDRKKEKTLETISKLNKAYFDKFLFEYKDLKRSKSIREKKMQQVSVMSEIKDNEYKVEHTLDKINDIKEKIEAAGKESTASALDDLKKRIQKEVYELMNIKLNIN